MVKKVCFRHASGAKRHQVNFSLGNISEWRERHPRLFNFGLIVFVAGLIIVTLVWQQPSIAKKLASTGLDDYFKEDVLADQKDDADRDGLIDAREAELKTDTNKPDTDGDGLLDGEEVNTYKTNPLATDTDGDKFSDATEVLTGHDPSRPAPVGDFTGSGQVAGTVTNADSGQVTAESLDSISQLLNGDNSESSLALSDINLTDLSDVASAFGAGNTAEIVVTDSDVKIIDVPENAAKDKIDQYLGSLGELMMEVFKDELSDPQGSQENIETAISSGNFSQLDPSAKKAQVFSDRLVKIEVPVQAKEFHKLLLKIVLEGQSLAKYMQQMESDSMASLVVLDQVTKLEDDLAEFQATFNEVSTKYELGYQLNTLFASSDTATSTGSTN